MPTQILSQYLRENLCGLLTSEGRFKQHQPKRAFSFIPNKTIHSSLQWRCRRQQLTKRHRPSQDRQDQVHCNSTRWYAADILTMKGRRAVAANAAPSSKLRLLSHEHSVLTWNSQSFWKSKVSLTLYFSPNSGQACLLTFINSTTFVAGVGRNTEAPSSLTGKIGHPSIGRRTELIMNKDEGKPAWLKQETWLHIKAPEGRAQGFGAAGSGSAGFSGALNDPAIYLALNTLAPAICHKPRASLCAIRLPLNCSKLAVGFFTLCL